MNAIHYWRYRLKSRAQLNSASSRREFEGALIRVGQGFGCLHPWPELGDLSLDGQLECLKSGAPSPLTRQAMRCAKLDGQARESGCTLFKASVPSCHWLVLAGDLPEQATRAGFKSAKMKIGIDVDAERKAIELWADSGFTLRLDANEKFELKSFLDFWYSLGGYRESIEFVEDPSVWGRQHWTTLSDAGIPIAVDRDAEERFESGYIAVIKPALSEWIPPEPEAFLFTSYMDHPVGQVWAASVAARAAESELGARLKECGLLTQRCYEPNEFSECLVVEEGRLMPPPGTGLGFDELLEGLPWKPLN